MEVTKAEAKNLKALLKNRSVVEGMHASEIAKILTDIHREYEDRFHNHFLKLPDEKVGEVLVQLPEKYRADVIEKLNVNSLKSALENLETDDATDLLQEIEAVDEVKAQVVMDRLSKADREELKKLKGFEESEAGAFMQTELFDVKLDEKISDAIARLRKLKDEGELENVNQAFVADSDGHYVCGIWLEDLITYDFTQTFRATLEKYGQSQFEATSVKEKDDIKEIIRLFEQYDLSVVPVVDENRLLVGRITSDDVYDIIEESHTEQLYNLAGVDDEAEGEEQLFAIWRKRALWLSLNLLTAILASVVIGLFEGTIESYVALAILMPIVSSLGGNAGMQSLTVVIRKIALGEIEPEHASEALKREVAVASLSGLTFAVILGIIAFVWFGDFMLGIVIGLAIVFTLILAGFIGTSVPLALKKAGIDPAVGSSVLLTTTVDIIGFFSFLGLATLILM